MVLRVWPAREPATRGTADEDAGGTVAAGRGLLVHSLHSVHSVQVQDLLPYGFAVHHAGLPRADRKLVEARESQWVLGSKVVR